jgi:hypothetical protein
MESTVNLYFNGVEPAGPAIMAFLTLLELLVYIIK